MQFVHLFTKSKFCIIGEGLVVEALRQELIGCQFADQCDMAGRYEYERIRAIKNILEGMGRFPQRIFENYPYFCRYQPK